MGSKNQKVIFQVAKHPVKIINYINLLNDIKKIGITGSKIYDYILTLANP